MESVGSNSVLGSLRLLHRIHSNFFILGSTGNVYTVNVSSTPSCTCPHPTPTPPCKHILFVFLRVLCVSLDDVCLRRRNLRPCQLRRLLATPTSPESVAEGSLRQRFRQVLCKMGTGEGGEILMNKMIEIEEGSNCPICLEEMEREEKVVTCERCQNPIHHKCLVKWKKSRGKRRVRCVICRAKWKDNTDHYNNYLNLSAYYVTQDHKPHPSTPRPLFN